MATPDLPGRPDPEPKVLYIVGKGRSGSTILDLILGEMKGYFSTGQLRMLWTHGLIIGNDCGCGVPVPSCEIWGPVLDALGSPVDARRIEDLQRTILSWKQAPRMIRAARQGAVRWPELTEYAEIMRSLYQSIAAVTGASVIVDSSKAPAHPGALGLVPGIEPYVVHLVRDPRAVAYSWRRRKATPGRRDRTEMPRFGPVYSSMSWVARNLIAERTRRVAGPHRSMVLRYEDLAERPVEAVSRIARMLEEEVALPFVDDRRIMLSVNHTVSGNPVRSNVGEIEVRPDAEWAARIPRSDRAVVSVLTSPRRKRYGY